MKVKNKILWENCLTLTIHGAGYLIWVYKADNPLFHFASKYKGKQMEENILNNLPSTPNQKHPTYLDYDPDEYYIAYKADHITRLEIKTSKKKHKLFFKEVSRNDILFPSDFIKKTTEFYFEDNTLYIIEDVIGNFGTCSISEKHFFPKLLRMNLINFNKNILIGKIYYNNLLLRFEGEDILNRGIEIRKNG